MHSYVLYMALPDTSDRPVIYKLDFTMIFNKNN